MRAMLLEAAGGILHERDLPEPAPGPGQLLVRVQTCGVCRSDLHVMDGDLSDPKLPLGTRESLRSGALHRVSDRWGLRRGLHRRRALLLSDPRRLRRPAGGATPVRRADRISCASHGRGRAATGGAGRRHRVRSGGRPGSRGPPRRGQGGRGGVRGRLSPGGHEPRPGRSPPRPLARSRGDPRRTLLTRSPLLRARSAPVAWGLPMAGSHPTKNCATRSPLPCSIP